MASMKGMAVVQLVKLVRRWAKQEGIEDVAKALDMEGSQILSGHVIVSSWYPYEEFAKLLKAMGRLLGGNDPDFFIRMGRVSAETDLDGTLSSFARRPDFSRFVRGLSRVWKAYSDRGELRIQESGPNSAEVTFERAPHLAHEHCLINQGWIAACLEHGGAKDARVSHDECVSRGDNRCLFRVSFKPG